MLKVLVPLSVGSRKITSLYFLCWFCDVLASKCLASDGQNSHRRKAHE